MLRSIPLRLKLLTALVLPMLVVGGYLYVDIVGSLDHRSVAAAQRSEVDAHEAVSEYAAAIGAEQLTMSRPDSDAARLEAARAATDTAYAALRSPELGLSGDRLDRLDAHQRTLLDIRGVLGDDPAAAWAVVNSERQNADSAAATHSTAMSDLADLPVEVLATFEFDPTAIDDAATASLVDDDLLVQRARVDVQREVSVLLWASALPAESVDDDVVVQETAAAAVRTDQSLEVLTQLGSTDLVESVSAVFESTEWADYLNAREATGAMTGAVDDAAVLSSAAAIDTELRRQSSAIIGELQDRASTSEYDARRDLVTSGLIGLWLVVCVGLLLRLLYRAIREPLQHLTEQAGHVARVELPMVVEQMRSGEIEELPPIERIPAESKDEVGALVMAFNDMHRSAVELAAAQAASRRMVADMFVNLGRRNQRLVARLLNGLSTLELGEQDPDALAALYDLDHTATRMRRNAESLLVLAGASHARRFDRPVAMEDVAQAAISEVENYQRVSINVNGDDRIDGAAVSDVTHLLAELVENALAFSPPNSVVEIVAGRTASGYVVAVTDHGIGMLPEQFDDANCRIAGAAVKEETPSDFLGHYVIGRLAARHGITVVLAEGPAGGVTARIWLPASIVVGADGATSATAESSAQAGAPAPVEMSTSLPTPPAAAVGAALMPPTTDPVVLPVPRTGPVDMELAEEGPARRMPSPDATAFLAALEREGVQQRTVRFEDDGRPSASTPPPAQPTMHLDRPAVTPLPAWTPLASTRPIRARSPRIPDPSPVPAQTLPPALDASPFGGARRTPGAHLPQVDVLAAARDAASSDGTAAESTERVIGSGEIEFTARPPATDGTTPRSDDTATTHGRSGRSAAGPQQLPARRRARRPRRSDIMTATVPDSITQETTAVDTDREVAGLGFLLDRFVEVTEGVVFAQTVSADGIHLAASAGFDRARHDTFAAIASGLTALTDSSVELFGLGSTHRQIIEATNGWVMLSRVSDTASLGVIADRHADLGLIGYEMTRLSQQLGPMLSPAVIDRLKGALLP
jgi:predicted regulator of Ras-like GTPase activity (Roadblock/LC7/MglB family)/signal transduction histidine kinase